MSRKRTPSSQTPVSIVHPDAAGIDIGSERHFVAVPADRDPRPVREFRSFTADLERLADWLTQCRVRTVAMESTGVYWIPVFELLERRGFEVRLVDARHVHHVPGRKSDVLDCQWIQQLHSYGLLRGSFRPEASIATLRSYLRQRERLVQMAVTHVQHMQKAFTQMNIQLHHVISDLTGKTGMRIVRALVAGEYDPEALAEHRDPRCRASRQEIAASLRGHYRAEHLFAVRQALELYDVCQQKIADCDREIEQRLEELTKQTVVPKPLPPTRPRKAQGNEPLFEIRDPLFRLTGGIDLTQIEGIGPYSALRLISEIGTDMSRWPSEQHFCAWLRLAPGTQISGGRRLDRRTPRGAPRAATLLRQAATTLRRTQTALGAFYRRVAARSGAGKAVVATAHKLARIIYALLQSGGTYQPLPASHYEARFRERTLRSLQRRARSLGYVLVAAPEAGVS
jgi:transposase